jgi:hypothetical protein
MDTSRDGSRERLKQNKLKSQGSKHASSNHQDRQRRPDCSENSQGSTDCYAREKSRKRLDRMEEAKETLSIFDGDADDVYLDEEYRPGTQALQEVVKRAVSKFSQEEYSPSIFKWIRKEMRGRRIFQTMNSQCVLVEASKKDLVDIFGDRYEYECTMFRKMIKKAEKYMAQANKRDVYFDVPDHPGTKAWKRVARHLAVKNPDEIYCKDIFTEIRLQLDGSSYYTGKPPKCHNARKQEIIIRFGECFDDEKASIMGQSRTSRTDEVLSKDNISEAALRRRRCDSTVSETEGIDATLLTCVSGKRRPVPGYLYWILLRQMISNRWARWDWYQRTSKALSRRVATSSIVVQMQPWCRARMHPYWMRIKEACCCGKDPESGEDIIDRLAAAIEIEVCGHATSWPFILLIGGLCAIAVFSIIYAIGNKLLLGLLY